MLVIRFNRIRPLLSNDLVFFYCCGTASFLGQGDKDWIHNCGYGPYVFLPGTRIGWWAHLTPYPFHIWGIGPRQTLNWVNLLPGQLEAELHLSRGGRGGSDDASRA